jgi:tellurite resistance protein
MDLPEEVAYAQASWARLEGEVHDDLLRAVCAAFAFIATADGAVSREELQRFLDVVRESAELFPNLDLPRLEQLFRDLTQALLTDPEGGRRHALSELSHLRDRPEDRALVRHAARLAMYADRRIARREEALMDLIDRALGLG